MEENVPKSIFGVQLSIAQHSIYRYNDTRSTMAGCDAGGLRFYTLFSKIHCPGRLAEGNLPE